MGGGGDKKTRERGIGEFQAAGTEVGRGHQKQQQRMQEKKGFLKGNNGFKAQLRCMYTAEETPEEISESLAELQHWAGINEGKTL